ncbi:hypothetical protein OsJ_18674 [Oryza sativa Japonica Group]|uniref:Protein YIP n=1 Tax=Oryza sativa subsp. japonica TaxID=39947 RepID=B9FPT0_ORYSJ|nr:hypothetical protein OsJ_18674 [Oryza sativa Japonica Group]
MSHGDTIPLHSSSAQSDMDEIESLIHAAPPFAAAVLHGGQQLPPRASIPVSSSPPLVPPRWPGPSRSSPRSPPPPPWRRRRLRRSPPPSRSPSPATGSAPRPTRSPSPCWTPSSATSLASSATSSSSSSQTLSVRDPGKALRDWDLWGPFFFIVFLGLTLSWSASVKKSEVFAVAFAVLAAGAIILTLNVLLLGGRINFFQSLSLLGYCLFPLDVGALICMLKDNVLLKIIAVVVTLAWSSWAAYPFMSAAVNPRRKALALYPVFLMYVSVGFLIIAID